MERRFQANELKVFAWRKTLNAFYDQKSWDDSSILDFYRLTISEFYRLKLSPNRKLEEIKMDWKPDWWEKP